MFFVVLPVIFLLRLLPWRKLRLSRVAVCVLGCFLGLGFGSLGGLRLLVCWRMGGCDFCAAAICFLGCFFGSAFEALCGLRLFPGQNATFNVDSMLLALSVSGAVAFWAAGCGFFGGGKVK